MEKRKLILENGRVLEGTPFGGSAERVLELVFNTTMIDYQGVIAHPASVDQAVVLTYPMIGSCGITKGDLKDGVACVGALIIGEYNAPNGVECERSLCDLLSEAGIPGIVIEDTRELARLIRDSGTCRVLITDRTELSAEEGVNIIATTPIPSGAVERVASKRVRVAKVKKAKHRISMLDLGARPGTVDFLCRLGWEVTVLPPSVDAKAVLAKKPQALLLSAGPGDPAELPAACELIRALSGKLPMLGIGLGHQLLCLAHGAKVEKMKVGHRGCNLAVKDAAGTVRVTTHNHGYTVAEDSLAATPFAVTCRHLSDGTVEGVCAEGLQLLGVQYEPTMGADLSESDPVFTKLLTYMEE